MSKPNLKITFCGAVGSATGANFLLEGNGMKILVDCGMQQGTPDSHAFNQSMFPYDPSSIDYLLVTHAHIDHIGRIPKLIKDGFKGQIISTPETREITEVMFDDMVRILDMSARNEGTLPLYGPAETARALALWKTMSYHTDLALEGGFKVYTKDAGHILGSTIYEISFQDKKIAFTGDLGNTPTPLLKDTEWVTDADYMVMESVYGDRNHEPHAERRNKLKQAILDITKRKGVLVIPAFSIERTQVLLYEINNLFEEEGVPIIPVFVDSPLAIRVTHIYKGRWRDFNAGVQGEIRGGDDIFNFPKLKYTLNSGDSRAILNVPSPKIVIAGSGMSEGGRIVHHEKQYLPDPNNIILLVGYQSVGTLGRRLQDGEEEVYIMDEKVEVNADIRMVSGYSSHKDSDHLLEFVEKAAESKRLKKVFLVMGEPKSSMFLAQRIRDYVGIEGIFPSYGKEYPLD
jgi:metallo-beta-lactamase family protein